MGISIFRLAGAPLIAAAIASCAPLPCGPAETRYAAQLFFGRAIGTEGEVSEAEFQDFLAAAVTPSFPDGLTVIDSQGQWKDATTGAPVRERSKVVTILFDDPAAVRPRLDAIADAYKQRFRQDAVAIVIAPACVTFR
jgi:hypothetical protein